MNRIRVPYTNLIPQHAAIKNDLFQVVERIINHGQYILGPEVLEFEKRFAEYCGIRHAIGVDNGTGALHLTMRCLGIGPGDEVITVPNSFIASASSIILTGARPVFVDVCHDYNMDSALLEDAITPNTKAIMPVHLTGRPVNIKPILDIARQYGLHVIEDCAQAVGAKYHGQKVGTFGVAGCFSFHPLKSLNACGDGGAIITGDDEIQKNLMKFRNHGLRSRDECEFWGFNSRLDTLQAGILRVKMRYLNEWIEARRTNALFYNKHLIGIVDVPKERPHEYAVYHTYVIHAKRRDALKQYLYENGVETQIHYPIPIHLQKSALFLGYKKGAFPQTEKQAKHILSLPIHQDLSMEQLEFVVYLIRKFYQAA